MSADSEDQTVRNRMAGLHLAAVAVTFIVFLGLLGWCIRLTGAFGEDEESENTLREARRTVIQIVLEGVRPEDLEAYALQGNAMPALGRFAREATWFDRHWAQSNGTSASFASLMSGLYSRRHGLGSVHRLGREGLSSEVTLLSEDLRSAGFSTLASLATPQFSSELSGFDQGWTRFSAPQFSGQFTEFNAEQVLASVWEDFEAQLSSSAACYALFEFRDPCEPFEAPARLEAKALARRLARFEEELPELRSDLQLARTKPEAGVTALRQRLGRRRGHAAWEELRAGQQEAEFAYLDEQLERLFAALRKHDRYQDALILVTGNVGPEQDGSPRSESFGRFAPSRMRVPLLVRLPGGRRSTTVQSLTRAIDLRATVLDALGLPCKDSDGASLMSLLDDKGSAKPPHDSVLFEDLLLAEVGAVDDFWFVQSRPGSEHVPLDDNRSELQSGSIPPVPKARLSRSLAALNEFAGGPQVTVELSAGLPAEYELSLKLDGGYWLDGKLKGDRARAIGRIEWFGAARPKVEVALAAPVLGASAASLELYADRSSPGFTLHVKSNRGELDESRIHFGDRSLSHLALPRLPASRSEPWPTDAEGVPAAPIVDITREAGRWLTMRIGGKPGQKVEMLLVGSPEGGETWDELLIDRGSFEQQPVAGRSDCRWVTGQTPLSVRVKLFGTNAMGLSVALEGEQVSVQDMRYLGRRFADRGEIELVVPSWLPGVHEALERIVEPKLRAAEPGAIWFERATQQAFSSDRPVPSRSVRKALSRLGDFE